MRLTLGRILLVAACLGIAGLAFHVHRGDAARNARYARIATEIAGRQVEVRCPSFWRKLVDVAPNRGTVRVEQGRVSDVTDLSVEICDALDDVVGGRAGEALSCLPIPAERCRRRLDAVAFGVEALTHESYHLQGILDEARAECYALQSSMRTAMALGLTADEATALNTYYASALYPRLPSGYHSSDCRPGGAFDLHPETPAWPGS